MDRHDATIDRWRKAAAEADKGIGAEGEGR